MDKNSKEAELVFLKNALIAMVLLSFVTYYVIGLFDTSLEVSLINTFEGCKKSGTADHLLCWMYRGIRNYIPFNFVAFQLPYFCVIGLLLIQYKIVFKLDKRAFFLSAIVFLAIPDFLIQSAIANTNSIWTCLLPFFLQFFQQFVRTGKKMIPALITALLLGFFLDGVLVCLFVLPPMFVWFAVQREELKFQGGRGSTLLRLSGGLVLLIWCLPWCKDGTVFFNPFWWETHFISNREESWSVWSVLVLFVCIKLFKALGIGLMEWVRVSEKREKVIQLQLFFVLWILGLSFVLRKPSDNYLLLFPVIYQLFSLQYFRPLNLNRLIVYLLGFFSCSLLVVYGCIRVL